MGPGHATTARRCASDCALAGFEDDARFPWAHPLRARGKHDPSARIQGAFAGPLTTDPDRSSGTTRQTNRDLPDSIHEVKKENDDEMLEITVTIQAA
jgi:hypothetical protein